MFVASSRECFLTDRYSIQFGLTIAKALVLAAAAVGWIGVYALLFRRRCMMGCLSVVASSWASVCLVPLAFANLLCMHILQQNGDVQFAAAAEVQAWMEAITINESIRTTTKPPANDRIIFNDTGSSPPQLDSPIGVFGV